MTEMETMWGVLAGLELYVECSLRDWYYYLTRTVHTYVKVLYDNYVLKQIGRLQLAFKPNIPFTVHVSNIRGMLCTAPVTILPTMHLLHFVYK
jgi:hypothetical protein